MGQESYYELMDASRGSSPSAGAGIWYIPSILPASSCELLPPAVLGFTSHLSQQGMGFSGSSWAWVPAPRLACLQNL